MTKTQRLEADLENSRYIRQQLETKVAELERKLKEALSGRYSSARDAHTKLVTSIAQMNEAIARTICEVNLGREQ